MSRSGKLLPYRLIAFRLKLHRNFFVRSVIHRICSLASQGVGVSRSKGVIGLNGMILMPIGAERVCQQVGNTACVGVLGEGLVAKLWPTIVTLWTIACQASLSMGILQARIPEWLAMPSSRGSSQPRDETQVSYIAGRSFTV